MWALSVTTSSSELLSYDVKRGVYPAKIKDLYVDHSLDIRSRDSFRWKGREMLHPQEWEGIQNV